MKKLEFTRQFVVEGKKRDILGEQLTEWFGKPLFWYKKFNRARVERIFNEMQKAKDHNFTHFMNKIHHD